MGKNRSAGGGGSAANSRRRPSAEAACTWAAVALARTWTATAYNLAAWSLYRQAWRAMAEAAAAGRNAAAAGRDAVGRGNRLNLTAFRNAVDALEEALRAQRRTRTAFAEAGAHAGASAAEWDTAAGAHAMAGNTDGERDARMRAGQSRDMAEDAAEWVAAAERDAETTNSAMHKWAAIVSERSDGDVWDGDRAAWVGGQESIHADAEYYIARWSEEADRANEAAEAAAGELWQYARAAQDAGAGVRARGKSLPPDALRAREAWNEAVRAAKKTSEMRVPPEVRGDQTA